MASLRTIAGIALGGLLAGAAFWLHLQTQGGDSIAQRAARDEVATIEGSDPDMRRAVAEARAELAGFLALHAAPRPGMQGFAVKIGLPEGAARQEFFWIAPFRRAGGGFTGRLSNTPRTIQGFQEGQPIDFGEAAIVDWLFLDEARGMRGNRTACVLLRREGAEQQREFQRRYGLDCARNGL